MSAAVWLRRSDDAPLLAVGDLNGALDGPGSASALAMSGWLDLVAGVGACLRTLRRGPVPH
eukprot:8329272-Lingulodinium_polyedra.AAC.1